MSKDVIELGGQCSRWRQCRALSVTANRIARRFARCLRDVKVTHYRAFCTSSTPEVYGVQYYNAFSVLLGLTRFCSASEMFAEALVDCFHVMMR